MRESLIASTAGELTDVCRHQSGSSFPTAPQVWFQFHQQTCLHVAAGKQHWGLFLLGSRYSGRAPAVVTPGGSRAGGDWLTLNLESKELPLLIYRTQTLGCLGNMDLYSRREAFSSQPSGNLDIVSCCFLREPLAEWSWGLRLAWMKRICSLFDTPNRSWSIKGLERVRITLMFIRDFALWIWLEKKDRNTGQGWPSLGPSWLWVEFQPRGFRVTCWCYSQAIIEEGIKSFGAERTVVKAPWESHGARWNKSDYLFLCFISSLQFLHLRTSTWR